MTSSPPIHLPHQPRSSVSLLLLFTVCLLVSVTILQVAANTNTLYPNEFDGTTLLLTIPTLEVTTIPTHIHPFNATRYPACATYAIQHALWSDDNFNTVNASGVNYHTQTLATSIATSVDIPAVRVSILDESALCADVTLTVLIDGENSLLYYGEASSAAATLFIDQFNGGNLVNLQNIMNLALNITNFQILSIARPGSYVNSNIVDSSPRSTVSVIASLLACFICPLIGAAVALVVYARWVKVAGRKARKIEKQKAKALLLDESKQDTHTNHLREAQAVEGLAQRSATCFQISDIGGGPGLRLQRLPSLPPSSVAISVPSTNVGSDLTSSLSISESKTTPSANAPPTTAASVLKSLWTSMKDKDNLQFFVPLFLFVFALGIIPYITTQKGTAWHSRGGVNAETCALFGYTSTQTAKCSDDLSWSMLQPISDVMVAWCTMFLGLLACCTGLFAFQADGSLFPPLLGLYFLGDFFAGMQTAWVANFSIRVGQVNISTMIAVGQLIQTCFAVLVLTLCLIPLQDRLSKTVQPVLLCVVGGAIFIVHLAVGQTIDSLSVDGIMNVQKASLAFSTLSLVLAVIALTRAPSSHELILRGYTFAMLSVWIGLVILVALQIRATTAQDVDLLSTPLNGEKIHIGLYTIMAQLIAMSFVIRHGICAYTDMNQVNSVLAVISTISAKTASQAHAKIMSLLPANFRTESDTSSHTRRTKVRSYRRIVKHVLCDPHLYLVMVLAGVFTIVPITTNRFVQFCQVKGFGSNLPTCALTSASALRGSLDHEVLELSSAFLCITVFLLSLSHFHKRRDWITVMYGLAFLGTGCADIFHTLVGMRIIHGQDNTNFIPFSWALARIYNSVILVVGTGFFLFVGSLDPNLPHAYWVICGLGLVLLLPLLGAMIMVANITVLPTTEYSTGVARPYDVLPLALYILFALEIFALCVKESLQARALTQAATIPRPRPVGGAHAPMLGSSSRGTLVATNSSAMGVTRNTSIIDGKIERQPITPQSQVTFQGTNLYLLYALAFSSLPQIITQCYMAFGSTELYDDNFNIAHFLKIVAYLFPFLVMVTDIGLALTEKNRVITALNTAISEIRLQSSTQGKSTFQPTHSHPIESIGLITKPEGSPRIDHPSRPISTHQIQCHLPIAKTIEAAQ